MNQAKDLPRQPGTEPPVLPSYDPTKVEKQPWEDEVRTMIDKLEAGKAEEKAQNPPPA